jgi:hypothetical protein
MSESAARLERLLQPRSFVFWGMLALGS